MTHIPSPKRYADAEIIKEDAAAAAKKNPPNVLQIKLSVTDQKSVESAAADIERRFGRLDILVHNAGIFGTPGPIADSDPEDWWKTWDVNVRGPYLVARAFLPLLLKGGDKQIVNVSSVGAHHTGPGLSAYQTSKLALLRFTEFIVSEYGEKGVLAFCIHPGNIVSHFSALLLPLRGRFLSCETCRRINYPFHSPDRSY